MKAFLEPLVGQIRVGPDTDEYGKDWDYIVDYVWAGHGACILTGLKSDGGFTTAHARAIGDALKQAGFHKVTWDRINRGAKRPVTVPPKYTV